MLSRQHGCFDIAETRYVSSDKQRNDIIIKEYKWLRGYPYSLTIILSSLVGEWEEFNA